MLRLISVTAYGVLGGGVIVGSVTTVGGLSSVVPSAAAVLFGISF